MFGVKEIVVSVVLGLAIGPAWACQDCDALVAQAGEDERLRGNGMPPVWFRDAVFRCTGVEEYIGELDHLDRDVLYMRARSYAKARLFEVGTDEEEPQLYTQLMPEQKLARLHEVLGQIARPDEVSEEMKRAGCGE